MIGSRWSVGLWLSWLLAISGPSQAWAADPASLQRGERMFMEDCAGCHSLKYLRYNRIQQDLGLSPAEMHQDLRRFGAHPDSGVISPMTAVIAGYAFGKTPPDLSLEVRLRGRDWVRRYLTSFYLDPSGPQGWNNPLLPNVAMPDPFWRSQGIRGSNGHGQPGEWLVPGQLTPAVFQRQVDDLVGFLQYAAAPDALPRRALGPWVLLFLAVFTALAYALRRSYWKDVGKSGEGA